MDKVDSNRSMPDDDDADEDHKSSEQPRSDAGTKSKPDSDKKSSGGDKDGDDTKKKKSSKIPLIILAIVVIIGAIAGGIYWFLHRNQTDTDDAYTDGRVVTMASQVNGYVTVLAVNDNQFVHKGDLLVQIDARPYQAALDQAQGQLVASEAQLNNAQIALQKATTTYPAQLAQAQGQLVHRRRALSANAQSDYKRQHAVERGATTQQNVDQSTASFKTAQGQVQVAQAQVDMANLIPQDIEQAKAQVKQLEGQVLQMQAQARHRRGQPRLSPA